MTDQPKASDLVAEARKIANLHLGEGPPYTRHLYEACNAIRRLADELEKSEARYREAKDVADSRTKASLQFLHERNQARAREARYLKALKRIGAAKGIGMISAEDAVDVARRALSEETTKE